MELNGVVLNVNIPSLLRKKQPFERQSNSVITRRRIILKFPKLKTEFWRLRSPLGDEAPLENPYKVFGK